MNQNWPRWIIASVAKHFDDRRQGLKLFMEGMDHVEDKTEYIELRIDGPYILELSKDYFKLTVEVNVLVQSARNPTDLFKIYKDCGIVVKAFSDVIKIFKYGNGDDDDQSLLGCMILVHSNDAREALRVSHFGQHSAMVPMMRSSVEGHYDLFLHE